jgi:hypothetical protein
MSQMKFIYLNWIYILRHVLTVVRYAISDKFNRTFYELHVRALIYRYILISGARSGVVGWGTMLQAGRLRVRIPMRSLDFFQFT